jgi:hypothetical protein
MWPLVTDGTHRAGTFVSLIAIVFRVAFPFALNPELWGFDTHNGTLWSVPTFSRRAKTGITY